MTNTYRDRIEEVTSLKGYTYRVWEYTDVAILGALVEVLWDDEPIH